MTENEVRQIVLKNYTEIFNSFIEDVESALNRRDRNELEEDILTSEDQVWRLYPYYKWLYWEYMQPNHIECPTYEFCVDFLKAVEELQEERD